MFSPSCLRDRPKQSWTVSSKAHTLTGVPESAKKQVKVMCSVVFWKHPSPLDLLPDLGSLAAGRRLSSQTLMTANVMSLFQSALVFLADHEKQEQREFLKKKAWILWLKTDA
ncbi:hypothetical protein HispidOSU_017856 [Sigmodon hispidus]